MFNFLSHLPSELLSELKHMQEYDYFLSFYVQSHLGRKKPILAALKLTHACNLECRHCPFWQKHGESLRFEQVRSCMQKLHDWGVRILILEGGEPFLWRDGDNDLRTVVEEARQSFFSVGVVTNGTFPIEANADIVWVSLDGLQPTHDQIRGASFERAIANIEASAHPRIYAHITINALNWQELPELVTFLASRVKGITIQFHYPYHGEGEADELFLPFKQREEVLKTLTALKQQGLPITDSVACLNALKDNRWKCHSWMLANVDPDGTMKKGCYVKERGTVACEHCGFAAHAEISLAYNGVIEAALVGRKIFERVTT